MQGKKSNGIKGGLIWSFGERIAAQLVSTVVTIILARLLTPEHYGIISVVTVFITLCNVFVTSGMGSAVVRKQSVEESDYNTAFYLSLCISIILYIALFFVAPYISEFYEMEDLTAVLRVMALRLPVASMNTIQQAHIQRSMRFKNFFIATLFGTVISGIVGILIALNGFGVWALVAQYLSGTFINTIILIFVDKWIPKFQFSTTKAKEIYAFGWKVLATDLISTLQTDIRSLIIGKVFSTAALAYFDQGKKYPSLLVNNLNIAINKVMLPAYAKVQDNMIEMKQMLRKSVSAGIFILAPIMIGMASVAENFVIVFLTEKWLPCVPYIQIFCIMYLTRPLETSCHQALLALGDSGSVLKIITLINIVGFSSLIITAFVFKSVLLTAMSTLLSTFVSVISFMICISKRVRYTFKEQMQDISPPLIGSVCMGISVYLISFAEIIPFVLLIIQMMAGALIYIMFSAIFKVKAYQYFKNLIMNTIRKKL